MARRKNQLVALIGIFVGFSSLPCTPARGNIVLNFSDVPPGTLVVASSYTSQGFILTSTSGGFVFNSPETGNGSPQPIGNNPFYAEADGLAAFAPASVTLAQSNGNPFSLLSIDLARNFAFDPPPTVTFNGTLAGGGTVTKVFSVTASSPPLEFQTFDFTGFTDLSSVSWDQGGDALFLHQFANIHLSTGVPEPSTLALLAIAIPLAAAIRCCIARQPGGKRRRGRGEKRCGTLAGDSSRS
jgi:hypothetical protein